MKPGGRARCAWCKKNLPKGSAKFERGRRCFCCANHLLAYVRNSPAPRPRTLGETVVGSKRIKRPKAKPLTDEQANELKARWWFVGTAGFELFAADPVLRGFEIISRHPQYRGWIESQRRQHSAFDSRVRPTDADCAEVIAARKLEILSVFEADLQRLKLVVARTKVAFAAKQFTLSFKVGISRVLLRRIATELLHESRLALVSVSTHGPRPERVHNKPVCFRLIRFGPHFADHVVVLDLLKVIQALSQRNFGQGPSPVYLEDILSSIDTFVTSQKFREWSKETSRPKHQPRAQEQLTPELLGLACIVWDWCQAGQRLNGLKAWLAAENIKPMGYNAVTQANVYHAVAALNRCFKLVFLPLRKSAEPLSEQAVNRLVNKLSQRLN